MVLEQHLSGYHPEIDRDERIDFPLLHPATGKALQETEIPDVWTDGEEHYWYLHVWNCFFGLRATRGADDTLQFGHLTPVSKTDFVQAQSYLGNNLIAELQRRILLDDDDDFDDDTPQMAHYIFKLKLF